jgi:predicted Zn-dependent peptidase
MSCTNGQSPYTVRKLDNGLTVVIEQMPDVRSVAAGFAVKTGARDDPKELAGVSHFLEHMMFKGTPKREWQQITIDFDRMGSQYNAYTSEDRTVYYGWVRTGDLEKQIELLADMIQSTLPPEEFATEKGVVLEEIAMSKDQLDHVAFDFLQEKVFENHPLGWPILGYDETLKPMTRDQMWAYFKKRYAPSNMMFVVAGNVDPAAVMGLVEKYCGSLEAGDPGDERAPATVPTGVATLKVDRFQQQVVALSFPSVSAFDPRVETVSAATTILGGDNSRFFWNIMQKGLALRAGAYHMDYTDCGIMILYGTCEPDRCDAFLEAVRVEANRICSERVSPEEADRVKNKRRTSLAIEGEAPYYRLTQLMDDMEFYGRPRTVGERLAEVDEVTPDTIFDYFQSLPINTEGHLTSVGPRTWPA